MSQPNKRSNRASSKAKKASGELRQSQMLTTFGPGSMVDLPARSVIISGLSYWKGDKPYIREDRLKYKVAKSLNLPDGHEVKLFGPPAKPATPKRPSAGSMPWCSLPGFWLRSIAPLSGRANSTAPAP